MLDSSPAGLSTSEAAARLEKNGTNVIRDPTERLTISKVAWSELKEPPIVLLLLVGVLYSFWGACIC